MNFISFWGNTYFLVPANLLLLFWFIYKKNKWWAIRVAAISLTSLGLMSLIKNLIHRHRPVNPLVDGITNYSFPSGHSFMSVAFYGLLIMWGATCIKNNRLKLITVLFFMLLILSIGFSRIYLRVHYCTDVIAGLSMSTAWLILSLALIDKLQARNIAERK
jgi:membrane-associated phospholipid phosphatase